MTPPTPRPAPNRHTLRALALALALAATTAGKAQEPPQVQEPPEADPLQSLGKDTLTGFRDRPLFNPARAAPRPPDTTATPPPAPPPPPDPPPDIRLLGIVSGPTPLALIRLPDTPKPKLLTTGDTIGPWTIAVAAQSVTLTDGSRTVAIDLFAAKGKPDKPDAAVPAGPDALAPPGDPPP